LLFAAAVLVSAWVLSDARRRFSLPAVAAWTLTTLISLYIILPLYLLARIFTRKPDTTDVVAASTSPADAEADDSTTSTTISDDTGGQTDDQSTAEIHTPLWRRRYALPLLYALALLSAGAIYFYRDYHTFDAHLARAANAPPRFAPTAPRSASPTTRTRTKLLAAQRAEDAQTEAALAEFRAAERDGEADELLPYRIAYMLDALDRPAEAIIEYQKFLRSSLCARPLPDMRCAEARQRMKAT